MFICVYDNVCGTGKTLSDAFEDLQSFTVGEPKADECDFYETEKAFSVEVKLVRKDR